MRREEYKNYGFNIGSDNGMVPSGNKPLFEPLLVNIFVAIRRHLGIMS